MNALHIIVEHIQDMDHACYTAATLDAVLGIAREALGFGEQPTSQEIRGRSVMEPTIVWKSKDGQCRIVRYLQTQREADPYEALAVEHMSRMAAMGEPVWVRATDDSLSFDRLDELLVDVGLLPADREV